MRYSLWTTLALLRTTQCTWFTAIQTDHTTVGNQLIGLNCRAALSQHNWLFLYYTIAVYCLQRCDKGAYVELLLVLWNYVYGSSH